jgi:foldase protein PrsA
MNDKWKGLLIGLVIGTVISGGAVVASNGAAKIDVIFKAMNFRVDGFDKKMTGTTPILYKGTTYVPLRFVGESLDWPVRYDAKTNTIWVGKQLIVANYKNGANTAMVTRQELERQIDILNVFNDFTEDDRLDPEFQTDFLNQLIAHRLHQGQLDTKTWNSVKAQAKTELANVKLVMNDQVAGSFQKQLNRFKLQEKDVLQFIEQSLNFRKVNEVKVTDKDARSKFDSNIKLDPHVYTTASVRHILISNDSRSDAEALELAQTMKQQLADGNDFAALAEQFSDDPGSASQGGLYADAKVSNWVPEFKNAAVTLPLNTVSDPVKTDYGYHIIRVEKRKVQTFADAKNEIVFSLASKRMNDYMNIEIPKLIIDKNLSVR